MWLLSEGIRQWYCLRILPAITVIDQQRGTVIKISSKRCPKLIRLYISGTRVSGEGVALFVACHPNAVLVEHEESFHGLALAQKQTSASKNPKYKFVSNLRTLMTSAVHLNPEDFEFAIDHCPMVEEVTILSTGLKNKNLYRLMNVQNLTSLHIGNKFATSFKFYQGLAPVLDACGATLKRLVLEDFTEIDIQFIGTGCQNLEHLALSGTTCYAPIIKIIPGLFKSLRKLELWNRDNRWGSQDAFNHSICSQTIKQLLSSAYEIDFVLFYKVDSITDILMEEIWLQNPMLKLHNVVFDHCQGITSATIWRLFELPNELSVLRCWYCSGVPEETRDEIKKIIRDENFVLYWEWYAFIENEDELNAALAAAAEDEE